MPAPLRTRWTVALCLVMVAGCLGCDPAPTSTVPGPAGPPSIVLISLDTTRADRLGCYGHAAAATPVLDRLAATGVRFERAFSPVPVTLPAHATMLTGLWPHRHGVRDNGLYRLPEDVPTLAERLADAGYDTAAVVAAAVLDRQYGLDRGFDSYDDATAPAGGMEIPERTASEVTDAALRAASRLDDRYFLFVHYFDPHADYRPPSPFRERFGADPYDGEIAYVDREIGRLTEGLRAQGRLENAVIVVTADHGESLGEHGEATHGVFLYQSTLRVPLLIHGPRARAGARTVDSAVSLADLAPTVLELAGIDSPAQLDGRSLAGYLGDELPGAGEDPLIPLESEHGWNSYGWAPLRGATDGRWKWIDAPESELYDLADDPLEARNRIAEESEPTRRLRTAWRALTAEDRRADPVGGGSDAETAERLSRLASLGYVLAPGGRSVEEAEGPDPKSVIGTLDDVNRGRAELAAGRLEAAEAIFVDVIERSPRNVSALVLLGSARILAGRHAESLEPLERAAALAPHEADVPFNLGLSHFGLGDEAAAEAEWRRTLDLAPRHFEASANLIDLLLRQRREADAGALVAAARSAGLAGPVIDYFEGVLAFRRGTWRSAAESLQRALAGGLPPALDGEARSMMQRIRAGR